MTWLSLIALQVLHYMNSYFMQMQQSLAFALVVAYIVCFPFIGIRRLNLFLHLRLQTEQVYPNLWLSFLWVLRWNKLVAWNPQSLQFVYLPLISWTASLCCLFADGLLFILQSLDLCSLIDLLELAVTPHRSQRSSECSKSVLYLEFFWKMPWTTLLCSKNEGFHVVFHPHNSHSNLVPLCFACWWVLRFGSQLHLYSQESQSYSLSFWW